MEHGKDLADSGVVVWVDHVALPEGVPGGVQVPVVHLEMDDAVRLQVGPCDVSIE